jgi:hypothetical protein
MVIPKELGRCFSAVTDTKLVSDGYSGGNESIIVLQGMTMRDLFEVHTKKLKLAVWPQRNSRNYQW